MFGPWQYQYRDYGRPHEQYPETGPGSGPGSGPGLVPGSGPGSGPGLVPGIAPSLVPGIAPSLVPTHCTHPGYTSPLPLAACARVPHRAQAPAQRLADSVKTAVSGEPIYRHAYLISYIIYIIYIAELRCIARGL